MSHLVLLITISESLPSCHFKIFLRSSQCVQLRSELRHGHPLCVENTGLEESRGEERGTEGGGGRRKEKGGGRCVNVLEYNTTTL
jgi:hypothetical protein